MSELYIVATPIGNLGDMTFRAVEILKAVDVVAAEDTRHTLQLLNHFEIRKPLVSCRAQNEQFASEKIIKMLDAGQKVAYASDAGTPGISDPGAVLAGLARKAGHSVIPVPGASAFAALASVAGAGGKTLIFEGFLSPKPGRRKSRVKELLETGDAVILYESPFRIVKLLADIADMHIHAAVIGFTRAPQPLLGQFVLRHHTVRRAQQQLQQIEFRSGQIERLAAPFAAAG